MSISLIRVFKFPAKWINKKSSHMKAIRVANATGLDPYDSIYQSKLKEEMECKGYRYIGNGADAEDIKSWSCFGDVR